MMNFMLSNIGNILVILVFILGILFLIKRNNIEEVKMIAFSLVLKMEEKFGNGTGEIKYANVVKALYENLPSILIFLFTEKEIDNIIEEAVNKMKTYLEKNQSDYINNLNYNKNFK